VRSKADEACIQKRRAAWHVRHLVTLVLICLFFASGQFLVKHLREKRAESRGFEASCAEPSFSPHDIPESDVDVYFSVRTGQKSYCVDYETVILDEIQDLVVSGSKDLDLRLGARKNEVTLYTPQGRKLKARIVRPNFCMPPAIAYTSIH
jgi:hypothetical protein